MLRDCVCCEAAGMRSGRLGSIPPRATANAPAAACAAMACASPGASPKLLEEVILRVFEDFDGPIAIGLRSGHVSRSNVTLTFGVEAELSLANEAALHLLEPAVAR